MATRSTTVRTRQTKQGFFAELQAADLRSPAFARSRAPSWEAIAPECRWYWEGECQYPWTEPLRRIYDTELVYTKSGRFVLQIGSRTHVMEEGSLALVPPATWHQSWVERGDLVFRQCLHFSWTPGRQLVLRPLQAMKGERFREHLVHAVPASIRVHLPLVFGRAVTAEIDDVLELVFGRLRDGRFGGHLLLWPALQYLLSSALSGAMDPPPMKAQHAVLSLKHFIQTRYMEQIDYDDFRRVTGLSASHLCTVFRRAMGSSPVAYLNQIRVEHAKKLLSRRTSVKQVAYGVGVRDSNYFARLFRKRTGVTPVQFLNERCRGNGN